MKTSREIVQAAADAMAVKAVEQVSAALVWQSNATTMRLAALNGSDAQCDEMVAELARAGLLESIAPETTSPGGDA